MTDFTSFEHRVAMPLGGAVEHYVRRHLQWLGLSAVAAVFAAGVILSWRRWPQVLADFGVQLYIPWRLNAGAVLYHDVFYVSGGPFSQYFDALLFRLFGISFSTLVVSNLVIVAGMVWLIYTRFRAASGAWVATAVSLGVLPVFVFGEYAGPATGGNWNYTVPYCEEALHSLALSILAVSLLADWMARGKLRSAATAGFCAGLVFLTKPDVFLALAVCALAAFVWFARHRVRLAAKSLVFFLSAGLLPPAGFLIYFAGKVGWREGLHSVVFSWVPVFNAGVVNNPLNRWCVGLDQPAAHLCQMLFQFIVVAGITAFYALVFRQVAGLEPPAGQSERRFRAFLAPPRMWQRLGLLVLVPPVLAFACTRPEFQPGESAFHLSAPSATLLAWTWVLAAALMAVFQTAFKNLTTEGEMPGRLELPALVLPLLLLAGLFDWKNCGASLPLLSATACLLTGWHCAKQPLAHRTAFPFLWSVFGLVMLSKLGLFPRIWHYGFVLAMPAFVSAMHLFLWLLPASLENKFAVPARLFRGTALLVLAIGAAKLSWLSAASYASQNLVLSRGGDKILTFGPSVNPGETARATLSWIESTTPPEATLAVLPEGITFNYLARRVNPTPCILWDDNAAAVYGLTNMVAAFGRNAPDYLVLIDRDPSDPGFGRDTGGPALPKALLPWIAENYQPAQVIEGAPAANGPMTVRILKRLPLATGAGER